MKHWFILIQALNQEQTRGCLVLAAPAQSCLRDSSCYLSPQERFDQGSQAHPELLLINRRKWFRKKIFEWSKANLNSSANAAKWQCWCSPATQCEGPESFLHSVPMSFADSEPSLTKKGWNAKIFCWKTLYGHNLSIFVLFLVPLLLALLASINLLTPVSLRAPELPQMWSQAVAPTPPEHRYPCLEPIQGVSTTQYIPVQHYRAEKTEVHYSTLQKRVWD